MIELIRWILRAGRVIVLATCALFYVFASALTSNNLRAGVARPPTSATPALLAAGLCSCPATPTT